ncbi:TonB-dependent receptor [Pontimicrobium aquaticum]|uniref:TonB-dependent receptor n=1 Tax=Pontimicrobium aquaticum TaxID=2565367 RepID=A0A4U0F2U3_9FLAO|nr:TonB-dependent receptor [Pontimicrobium aquaticum]TJY38094.1 TonB-dependent receptor [Pontimicrobium aquaticum]
MKKNVLIFLMGVVFVSSAFAQQTIIRGSVKDAVTNLPIPEVIITIEETSFSTKTDANGEFSFTRNVPLGEQVLNVSKLGYITARYPIVVNEGSTVNITDMSLDIDVSDSADLFTISLSDDELNDDTSGADNISGLLQSSQDVFLRTAAFEFGSSFFRVRGLDSENGTILINGVEMNKMFNGRPQWSNWGGLNDVMRNQEFTNGIPPSAYNFGGILGTTNINVRASKYRKGGRITYSSSNRSYTNRIMASYASGLVEGGWAYSLSLGRRWGNEGFQDGTFYDANSFFVSVEKQINDNHSINITGIYAPNRRGKSSPNTQEVYDLKDIRYNEYWGWQDGEKRNSRVKRTDEPIIMLNHYWDINDKTTLNTNLAYQFGELGNSRLDYGGPINNVDNDGGGANPSPAYYQRLPSYWLADDDLERAYEWQQEFINNGQINWNRMYDANITNNISGYNAAYVLYEDRSDDTQFTANTIFNTELTDNITLNGALNLRQLKSENFAQITDMLGSTTGYLNVDSFDGYQYDYRNPDRVANEGDKFRYNYNLYADVFSANIQAAFKYNKIDFYVAGSITNTQYQREGLYQHEAYQDNSYGKGKKLKFNGLGAKAGFTYKLTGKHLFDINAAYITKAPSLRNAFSNSRENHSIVGDQSGIDITEEKITSVDASYIFRSPIVKARLTGYYTTIKDANEISFFFADGIGGDNTAFVQEILQGVNKKHFGGELGIEAQVTPTIKLKGAASIGQFTYDNNPNLILTSDDFENGFQDFNQANLKDYKIAGGSQRAASVGFEYRDPDYWWFGATANFFSNAYLDVSPLIRTENFYLDNDGLPFNDYDPDLARELLKQEKFDDYMTVNLIGGKSWKIGDYFIGLFASVNNLLDKEYKTGGFEQGRNANFRQLRDDNANPKRIFGPKYWYGRGTTYFLNLNFRF